MKHVKSGRAIVFALLAAALYAISTPVSKRLLGDISPEAMAALLYLGAGAGMLLAGLPGRGRRGEKRLERGDVALEESLSLFEEGSRLLASCNQMLDAAEQKVIMLKKGSDGAPVELPFDTEEI